MTMKNHIVGGFAFTGVVGALVGINLVSNPLLIVACLFASVLPDIDHPSTLLGKLFKGLSKYINDNYGHRTATHSLLFLIVVVIVSCFVESIFLSDFDFSLVIGLALFSHLLFDMMTLQGVEFLYPFQKMAFVLPANPDYRFRVNDRRSEMIIFVFFCCSLVFLKPLLSNGFWTVYNSSFGTLKHVSSEFDKSEDRLFIELSIRSGSVRYERKGYVLACDGSSVLLDEIGKVNQYPNEFEIIENIEMDHTGVFYKYSRFEKLSPDDDILIMKLDDSKGDFIPCYSSSFDSLEIRQLSGVFLEQLE